MIHFADINTRKTKLIANFIYCLSNFKTKEKTETEPILFFGVTSK